MMRPRRSPSSQKTRRNSLAAAFTAPPPPLCPQGTRHAPTRPDVIEPEDDAEERVTHRIDHRPKGRLRKASRPPASPPPPAPLLDGYYIGPTAQGLLMSFEVTDGGTQVQRVTLAEVCGSEASFFLPSR